MIYDLATKELIQVPKWATERMKSDYPEFYKGRSLTIIAAKDKLVKENLYLSHATDKPPRIRVSARPPMGVKTKGTVNDPDGKMLTFQYTTVIPRNENNTLIFPHHASVINLDDNMAVNPNQEDLLFFLLYCCPRVKGNYTDKVLDCWYEFDRPVVIARSEIEKSNEEAKLRNFVYNECKYEAIERAMNVLGLKLSNDLDEKGRQDVNRYNLYKAIEKESRGETFKKNALELIGYLKTGDTTFRTSETESDLANRLLEEGKIKLDEGGWFDKDKRGDGTKWKAKPFYETTLKDNDARFALIDYFKANETAFSEYKKL